jgi:general secretion pathway protein I
MNRAAGFTLLEILVALTLFAIVGGALLGLFQTGLRATATSSEYTHAALLARSKLNELQVYTTLVPGTYEGEFDEQYRWRVTLTERAEIADASLLRQIPLDVALAVSWGEPTDTRLIELSSVLLSERAEP